MLGGVDASGTHLFETSPSGEYFEYFAQAIGARSQSAKTYLEKNYESFADAGESDLIAHGIKDLRASAQEIELNENNVSVGVLGKDAEWRMLNSEELKALLESDGSGDVEMVEA